MKTKHSIVVAIFLIATVSAAFGQQIVRPVPASSITNNRVTSIYVTPVQDTSEFLRRNEVGVTGTFATEMFDLSERTDTNQVRYACIWGMNLPARPVDANPRCPAGSGIFAFSQFRPDGGL